MASIGKDGASWYYVVSNGTDPITFKPKQIKKRGFKTKEEAEIAAMEVELLIKKNEYFKGENMRFGALYEEWLESYPYTRKISSTRNRIQSAKHLTKVWENVSIGKITKQVYRKYMNSLIDDYRYNTREGIHIVAKMIFDYAVDLEYLKINPTANYKVPRDEVSIQNTEQDKLVFLEKEELVDFIFTTEKHGLENDLEFFSLLAYSGMRIGEAICLKWEDIDFENESININKTYYNPNNNKYEFELTPPKTDSSKREILIDPLILDLLKSLRRKQNVRKNKNKHFYKDQDFVFTCDEGFPYSIRKFSQRLQRILKHMDNMEKHITPHSFRHTHASLLIEANANMKVISHRLGHATVATTDEIYGHLTRGLEKKASHQFSELMKDLVHFDTVHDQIHDQ